MTLQLVQISDTHISIDAPQRMSDLENCVQAINQLQVPPDLVVHTGDIVHNGSRQEYHSAQQLLNQLNVPYFVMAGNRDKRTELLSEFADKRYKLAANGWVQYSIEQYSHRLLMVDTVSVHSNKGQLCAERLQHLEEMLLADTTKPVALFLHHPPYEAVGIPDPFQYENWNDVENLTALLSRFSNICGMYCGHVHRFIDGSIAGIQASAISCLAGDLRKGEVTDADRKLPVFKSLTLPR
jgi:Icc protein